MDTQAAKTRTEEIPPSLASRSKTFHFRYAERPSQKRCSHVRRRDLERILRLSEDTVTSDFDEKASIEYNLIIPHASPKWTPQYTTDALYNRAHYM